MALRWLIWLWLGDLWCDCEARPLAWTIAGSDSGGGAGIQADLLAFHSLGVHGCAVLTALTAQNSLGVRHVELPSAESVRESLRALDEDMRAQAIKIGMLGSAHVVREVVEYLERSPCDAVVCDPVMVSSSGTPLVDAEGVRLIRERLLPRCRLVTPNIPEAEALLGRRILTPGDAEEAARDILRSMRCGAVLLKGGHGASSEVVQDVLCDGSNPPIWLTCARVGEADGRGFHGTGCTLSSAIAALLARNFDLLDAVVLAKAYVTQGILHSQSVGTGPNPVAQTGWPRTDAAMPWISRTAEHGSVRPKFARCDGDAARGLLPVVSSSELVARVVGAGARDVQIRLKGLEPAVVAAEVRAAQNVCAAAGARLWVNDYWREALSAGAYGVHVGQEDLALLTDGSESGWMELEQLAASGLRLGISTHTFGELAAALAVRPSYISIGPVFATRSKSVTAAAAGPASTSSGANTLVQPKGLGGVTDWRDLMPTDVPLIAIGGITLEEAPSVLKAGAVGLAVIGAVVNSPDVKGAVRDWLSLWPNG